jgi:autotransporter-associated beta strand protein
MKKSRVFRFLFALLGTVAPLWMCQAQTVFFTDNFSNGSTTNGLSVPGGTPSASKTSYDVASTKNGISSSSLNPNDLRLSLAATTSSGFFEAQAVFTTNAIELNSNSDYVDLAITFTNTMGTVLGPVGSTSSALWTGLFNSSATPGTATNPPVPGTLANAGLSTASPSTNATGNCAFWQGYIGQMLTGTGSKIVTRPVQVGSTSADQDLLGSGAGSGAFTSPAGGSVPNTGGSTAPAASAILTNVAYTIDLRITLSGLGVLTISNAFYQGNSTAGTMIWSEVTTNASGANFLASEFDGLAVGLRASGSPNTQPEMDISQILVTGQSTIPTGPPQITQQPVPTTVTTNGSCAFTISAIGANPTYQWYRNGTQKLSNGGNIAGATSDELIISPAGTADQFTGANNGYFCVVTGAGNFSTNSTTNTLTLITSTNLVWNDINSDNDWDVNNTVNWQDTNGNLSVFNFGDPVTFDETGQGGDVNLVGDYISPSQVTVNTVSSGYTFMGNGSIAGPCSIDYIGSGRLTFNCNDAYTGGTLISNATAYVLIQNYGGLSTGPITLGKAGGQMELAVPGSSNVGIQGNIVSADDFTILADAAGASGTVLFGDLSGTANKTLIFGTGPTNTSLITRIQAHGNATVDNANLFLSNNIVFGDYGTSGTQTYNGLVEGPGSFIEKGFLTIFNGANTFSGGVVPAQGAIGVGISSAGPAGAPTSGPLGTGPLLLNVDSSGLTGSGLIEATAPNITVGNPIQNNSGTNNVTLIVGGVNNITFSGPFSLNGNDGLTTNTITTRTLQATNTGLTTFSGVISDGGKAYGLNSTGNGVLIFANNETYTGPTTNSAGTLLVNGTLASSSVSVATNTTLGGIGTISGPVSILNGGTLTSGSQTTAGTQNIGTLTVNNTVTFSSAAKAFVVINKTASTHSLVNVSGAITYNGTLTATNISGTPVVGDQFTVFSAGSVSGNFTTIAGTPGPGLAWSFNPANGVLSVVSGVAPFTVPPHISTITLTGTNLTVTGTNAQSGALYYTLTTTNLQLPLSQWTPVGTNIAPGANNFSFTITNAVNPKDPRQFYILSNTNF